MDIKGHAAIVTGGASGSRRRDRADAGRGRRQGGDLRRQPEGRRRGRDRHQRHRRSPATWPSSEQTEAAFAKAAADHGPARILINCAGVGPAKRIVGRDGPMPLAEFERVIAINLIGTFNAMRLAAAAMQRARRWPKASAASSSAPRRSPLMRARSARPPMRRRKAAWSG